MEQIIRTYHNYEDDVVNQDIKRMNGDGWIVRQVEYSSQIVNQKLRSCVIVFYERLPN